MINTLVSEYIANISSGLSSVDTKDIKRASEEIISAYMSRNQVFVCGNGGSATISDHFLCDHSKGVHTDTSLFPSVRSLSSSMSLITALGNDVSYEEIFSYQLDMFGNNGDVLVAISSSGNSPNIIKALETAKNTGIRTIAFVGFDGGKAKNIADITLHVPIYNYGVVEDCHQALMHIIAQYIRKTNTSKPINELKL